jgi:hypothetical protein
MIDRSMCLPWFKGSDDWCASCAAASCFTVLLRERRLVQETFNFRVEWFVEEVGRHLCDLVYEWDSMRKLCFVNAGE